ncbi:MAG: ATP-binding protein [Chloroflexi bacterium HGW-Chloroflexi-1]|nr:MAG: ATP-binding protein [Chloroflexi bacterium HGW-Chloroflexi-1]
MRELSLHVLDALQNSLEAGATLVELLIEENLATDRLSITIRDNGRGMDEAQLARVFDPFYTTRKTRHVGLGVPLFKAAAARCNGDLTITSQVGRGATLRATFQHSHIDRAPLGDITGTLVVVILGGPGSDVHYVHRVMRSAEIGKPGDGETRKPGDGEPREFEFHTAEIKAELGDVPLTHPAVREWLRNFIAAGEAALSEAPIRGR